MARVSLLVLLVPAVVVAAALISLIAWRMHEERHTHTLQQQLDIQTQQSLTHAEDRLKALRHELDGLQATIPPLLAQVRSLTTSIADAHAQANADQVRWRAERAHLTAERDQARRESAQLKAQLQAALDRVRGLTAALAEARAAAETAEERTAAAATTTPAAPATTSTTSPAGR